MAGPVHVSKLMFCHSVNQFESKIFHLLLYVCIPTIDGLLLSNGDRCVEGRNVAIISMKKLTNQLSPPHRINPFPLFPTLETMLQFYIIIILQLCYILFGQSSMEFVVHSHYSNYNIVPSKRKNIDDLFRH